MAAFVCWILRLCATGLAGSAAEPLATPSQCPLLHFYAEPRVLSEAKQFAATYRSPWQPTRSPLSRQYVKSGGGLACPRKADAPVSMLLGKYATSRRPRRSKGTFGGYGCSIFEGNFEEIAMRNDDLDGRTSLDRRGGMSGSTIAGIIAVVAVLFIVFLWAPWSGPRTASNSSSSSTVGSSTNRPATPAQPTPPTAPAAPAPTAPSTNR